MRQHLSNVLSDLFRLGMWWRIFYGSAKTLLGISLLDVVGVQSPTLFQTLMGHELAEDPSDVLLHIISPIATHFPFTISYFLAFYLIFWGLLDVFLSVNLLRERHWAYPTSIALIGIFIAYEIVRVANTRSLVLAGIIVVDIFIVYLIRMEQKKLLTTGDK